MVLTANFNFGFDEGLQTSHSVWVGDYGFNVVLLALAECLDNFETTTVGAKPISKKNDLLGTSDHDRITTLTFYYVCTLHYLIYLWVIFILTCVFFLVIIRTDLSAIHQATVQALDFYD